MSAALLRSGALVAAGLALSASASAQTVDLLEVVSFQREGNSTTPYSFEVSLQGSGINSVTVESLAGGRGPIQMQLDVPGEFFLDEAFQNVPQMP